MFVFVDGDLKYCGFGCRQVTLIKVLNQKSENITGSTTLLYGLEMPNNPPLTIVLDLDLSESPTVAWKLIIEKLFRMF